MAVCQHPSEPPLPPLTINSYASTHVPMKTFAKNITRSLASSDALWPLLQKYLINVAKYAVAERAEFLFRKEFPDNRIAAGPFKGMLLPGAAHQRGSKLIPKFIGTYEAELNPVTELIIASNPPVIVDVGCAEGYYAVGFALRCPDSRIIAYDLDSNARAACSEVAEANRVEKRVQIESECTPRSLIELNLPAGSVIMSDCEGYELELFTPEVVKALKHSQVFIEVHDLYNPSISETLKQRFAATHHLQVIRSSHDKSDYATHPSLGQMTPAMLQHLTHEREANMDWFYLLPKP